MGTRWTTWTMWTTWTTNDLTPGVASSQDELFFITVIGGLLLGLRGPNGGLHGAGKAGYGRGVHQFADGHGDLILPADTRDDLGGKQRMAADLEEVIVPSDVRQAQYLAP